MLVAVEAEVIWEAALRKADRQGWVALSRIERYLWLIDRCLAGDQAVLTNREVLLAKALHWFGCTELLGPTAATGDPVPGPAQAAAVRQRVLAQLAAIYDDEG